jgi:predicted RNA-binding Zn ribbon-like protein
MAGRPAPRDLAIVNSFAELPTPTPQMQTDWSKTLHGDDHVSTALGVIARDAVDIFTASAHDRIRECASSTCSRLFIDRSRPGNRRWCSSTGCGNQAKTAAYRRRQSLQN